MAWQRHCRRLARNGKPGASLLTPSSNQLPRPARKAGFSTFESRSGRETDCLLEGDGFEPSVPHKKQPFLAAPVRSPQFAFRNKKRLFRARDRWFESISLQQGVRCELDPTASATCLLRAPDVPRQMFQEILSLIAQLRTPPAPA